MARQNVQFLAFNRGVVSRYGLARVDLQRMRYSAQQQTNWIPRVLGSMMLRPGSGYLYENTYGNAQSIAVPFIAATDDACFIEVSPGFCRFNVGGNFVSRVAVATAVTNGTFAGNIAGWTVADQVGALSAYDSPNQLGQTGTGLNDAIAYQEVSVAGGDQPKEHALRITVVRGRVGLRIGTVLGLDDLQEETYLDAGQHSIAFTPNAANFYIYFFNRTAVHTDISNCTIEAAGILVLTNVWAADDLPFIRWDQSADVLYVCDGENANYQFERRSMNGWSIVYYRPTNGPFRTINFSPTTITPSDINGDITLSANSPVFNPKMAGALFKLSSLGQSTDNVLGGLSQATTPAIRVTGQGPSRAFSFNTIPDGSWAGQLRLQVGQTAQGPWTNLGVVPVPTNDFVHNDGADNQILFYRIIVSLYTAGTVDVQLEYGGGSIDGYVRLLDYSDPQTFSAVVLSPLGNTVPTTLWYEGAWSFWRGWPTSLCLFEDRLWFFGLGQYWASVADAYTNFDDTTLGDSGPINRTVGKGPVNWINWGLGLLRLLVGTDGTLISARSDSLDTPLTPSNFNLKFPVTQGAARIAAINADDLGYFVHRNRVRVYELAFDTSNYIKLDYGATDMTAMCPEVCEPGIVKITVSRTPDTRIWAVLTDGTMAVMVGEKTEQVTAWIKYDMTPEGGFIEDVVVLPQPGFEDAVILIVRRVIDGDTVRYYEKFALESECVGATLNKQADCFVTYVGAATNVLSVPHLIGKQVVVWGDGKDFSPGSSVIVGGAQKTYLVDGSGNVTLDVGVTVSNAVIGLPYQATFEGAKLAYAAQMGSALTQKKRVASIGLILADVHAQGLLYGPGLERMDPMPEVVRGAIVPYDTITEDYDDVSVTFPGEWDSDSRLWLVAQAPRPCRVLAAVIDQITSEVVDGQGQGQDQG